MMSEAAPANPMMTTEIDASPVAPVEVIEAANSLAAGPEPLVDHGDPDIPHETATEAMGIGTEGEVDVWEARYSMRNFMGRIACWGVVTAAWLWLAVYTWGYRHPGAVAITIIAGIVLAFSLLMLARRMVLARFGHFYRLTNRRLVVSTGVFDRRRDQMELLRVQDVYVRQTLWQRWLGLGTVVVQSSEQHFPVLFLAGVDNPKAVNDQVWHHARAERDRRSVKVDQI